ncbi:MAG TPA: diheme cytochrome c-553 [Chitinophagaceae bacterium]|nr:diheme cytochrome c-553 [Chitinophagaceae bacterium]HCY89900.1 diheme cytochrome c-553 [Chitinophagaceae bacterium]HRF26632.1 c-type cytochrome [Ferruginibacter sp.]
MKKALFILAVPCLIVACVGNKTEEKKDMAQVPLTDPDLIAKGRYLVGITGCHDCHSPKIMTAQGPALDTSRLLSGHPSDMPIAPYDTTTTKNWVLFNMNQSAIKGPWGMSFSANLTPDDTGIGNWSEEHFSNALRKGYFKGLPGGRLLLPPMPWQMYAQMHDEDVRAIFAYLKSIKPVRNIVPAPIPPGA